MWSLVELDAVARLLSVARQSHLDQHEPSAAEHGHVVSLPEFYSLEYHSEFVIGKFISINPWRNQAIMSSHKDKS